MVDVVFEWMPVHLQHLRDWMVWVSVVWCILRAESIGFPGDSAGTHILAHTHLATILATGNTQTSSRIVNWGETEAPINSLAAFLQYAHSNGFFTLYGKGNNKVCTLLLYTLYIEPPCTTLHQARHMCSCSILGKVTCVCGISARNTRMLWLVMCE